MTKSTGCGFGHIYWRKRRIWLHLLKKSVMEKIFCSVMVYDFLVIKARETSPTWNVFGSFAISRPSCTLQVGIKMFHQFCINSFFHLSLCVLVRTNIPQTGFLFKQFSQILNFIICPFILAIFVSFLCFLDGFSTLRIHFVKWKK